MRLWFWYRGCGLHVPPTLSPYWAPPTFIFPYAPPRKYLHVRTFVRISTPVSLRSLYLTRSRLFWRLIFSWGLEDSSAVPLNGPFCAGFLGAWPTRAHLALTGHHAKKHPFFPISWALAQIPIKVFYSNFLIYHHRAQQKNIDLLRLLYFFFLFNILNVVFIEWVYNVKLSYCWVLN